MRNLATLAVGIALSCFCLATAQAQSPAVPSSPAQNPSGNMSAVPPDGSTQRDLKLEVPDGFGGPEDLPDATKADPDPSTGSVLITPTDPQILPSNASMLQETAPLLSILAIGFMFGYAVRAAISYHRRNEARRRRVI